MTSTEVKTRKASVWRSATAFFRIDFIEDINYPLTFAMQMLTVIVPLIPFLFISELVGRSPTVGGDYLTFTVIGLGMTTMLNGAMVGFGSSLQGAFQRGTLEVFLVEPIPWTTLPLAMNQYQVMLGGFSGLLLFGVGGLLGAEFDSSGTLATIAIALLGLLAAAAIGIISAAVLLLTLKSAPVLRIYGLAASLLAGSIFSVNQLPGWAKPLAYLLPHTYVINGARTALMRDPGSFEIDIATAIIALVVFDVVFFTGGLYLFRKTLELSRKMGTLGGY